MLKNVLNHPVWATKKALAVLFAMALVQMFLAASATTGSIVLDDGIVQLIINETRSNLAVLLSIALIATTLVMARAVFRKIQSVN